MARANCWSRVAAGTGCLRLIYDGWNDGVDVASVSSSKRDVIHRWSSLRQHDKPLFGAVRLTTVWHFGGGFVVWFLVMFCDGRAMHKCAAAKQGSTCSAVTSCVLQPTISRRDQERRSAGCPVTTHEPRGQAQAPGCKWDRSFWSRLASTLRETRGSGSRSEGETFARHNAVCVYIQ